MFRDNKHMTIESMNNRFLTVHNHYLLKIRRNKLAEPSFKMIVGLPCKNR